MDNLKTKIRDLKHNKNISNKINLTLQSFKEFQNNATKEDIFSELSFCILTANCQAKNCITIQSKAPFSFLKANEKQIKNHLIKHHYRFPNIRTQYILKAQPYANKLQLMLKNNSEADLREWIIKHIKGLGMKESSHFLRNIGYQDYAIIDTHILSLLQTHQIINKPKIITKKKYLQIENHLKQLAKETMLTLASLDLYLWYLQTGLILK